MSERTDETKPWPARKKRLNQFMLTRHATLKEAAGLICRECAKKDVPERTEMGYWIHTMLGFDDRTEDCRAGSIQERIYQESHKEQT